VLLLKNARPLLHADIVRLEEALRRLAEQHEKTVMLGRTLLQAAPPVTFGLKAAGWLGAVRRDRERLRAAFNEVLVLQFGGASGTLAALGEHGPAIGQALAQELSLGTPDAPWHTHRDRLAAFVCALGVLTGSLGKMARDISLLMQSEVAEASEPSGEGRGGSSAMPHKRNPVGCLAALAAAQRVPGLVATFLSCMVQEHERGLGPWQAEWPTIAAVVQATGVALHAMAEVAEGLSVDEARMRKNIEMTQGTVFAEKVVMLLGPHLGRDVAHRVLEEATRRSLTQKRHLSEVLGEMPEIKQLAADVLSQLEEPALYLGAADIFRANLLAQTKTARNKE
jgi:3-carboxy-cis,cis-muconate cycloisomerase